MDFANIFCLGPPFITFCINYESFGRHAVKILLTHIYIYISNSCNSGPRCSSLKATLRLLNRDEVEIDMPSSADSSDEALCRYYADTMQSYYADTMHRSASHCIAVHLFSHCDLFGFPGEQTSNSRGS